MKRLNFSKVVHRGILVFILLGAEVAMAQFSGGGLEAKVNGITNSLIHFVLPAASVFGLIYSAILAASGDASAKSRMLLVGIASIAGFLAPMIIGWLKGLAL